MKLPWKGKYLLNSSRYFPNGFLLKTVIYHSGIHLLCSSGVNFTNNLLAAFIYKDPKSAKKDSQARQLFALLGSARVKAACKYVDEIDP